VIVVSWILVPQARQEEVFKLPADAMVYLLPSRYCESDSELASFAWEKFGPTQTGWERVQAICDFVHQHVKFDYDKARSNRTALETFRERVGVCRDFTHLAITLCRCLNIPARYVTGYLGDIGVPPAPYRWTLAPGWRFTSAVAGLRSILGTIAGGSAASLSLTVATPAMCR
jgi:transglutaminase-like putative cysteine protease